MKKITLLLILISTTAFSQVIDYNKIIIPKNVESTDLGERLVQIAWDNNPTNKAIIKEKEVAKQNLRIARWQFLDNIYGSSNINEFSIDQEDNSTVTQNPNYVPKYNPYLPLYNFGVKLSLGDLVSMPLKTKKAREEVNLATENINARKVQIRSLVLTNYQNYLMYKDLLKIQNEIAEDANAGFSLSEKKFKDGDLSFEEYNKAIKTFNEEKVKKIHAENDFMLSKIKLEELIGVRIEDVE